MKSNHELLKDRRSDPDVARAALISIRSNVGEPADRVRVLVDRGCVTLEGKVAMQRHKEAAEKAVSTLWGVRNVLNAIQIAPVVTSGDIEDEIRSSFEHHADLDANDIDLQIVDGVLTLAGAVSSYREREDAEAAARSAPGVAKVENLLVVRP